MVIFGMVAGFLLAAALISLAVFGVLPVFERKTSHEDADHLLVIACLENVDELIGAAADAVEPRSTERHGAMSGGRWR